MTLTKARKNLVRKSRGSLPTYPSWVLSRWVRHINPSCTLTDDTICKTLKSGDVLINLISLTDTAFLTRGRLGKARSREEALSNLHIILHTIYDGTIPIFINANALYITTNPNDWWCVLSHLFYSKAYLPIKRYECRLDSLRHMARDIGFPIADSKPSTDVLLYVFLLCHFLPVQSDLLSLITIKPISINQTKLNWLLITLILNKNGFNLMFTPRELAYLHRGQKEPLPDHFLEYILLSLIESLDAYSKTTSHDRKHSLISTIRQWRQNHPDKKLYYSFADSFVILNDSQIYPQYISRSQGERVQGMLSLNKCFGHTTAPCTIDHRFFVLSVQIARNIFPISNNNCYPSTSHCLLLLAPENLTIVTPLDEFVVPLAVIIATQVDSAGKYILLICHKDLCHGLETLFIRAAERDICVLVKRLRI